MERDAEGHCPKVCANPITVICPNRAIVMDPITEMEVAHTVGPCTFSFCCRRATTTTSELLWKAISLVGQKILKRLFILNVAALKGSGLVAVQAINLVVVGSICTTAKAQRPTLKHLKWLLGRL